MNGSGGWPLEQWAAGACAARADIAAAATAEEALQVYLRAGAGAGDNAGTLDELAWRAGYLEMAGHEAASRLDHEQATWEEQEEAEQAEWRDFECGHREQPDREAGS